MAFCLRLGPALGRKRSLAKKHKMSLVALQNIQLTLFGQKQYNHVTNLTGLWIKACGLGLTSQRILSVIKTRN